MKRFAIAVSLGMLVTVSGCCRAPRVKPPVVVETTERACLETVPPAPERPPNVWEQCDDWETCLTGEGADRLGDWIDRVLSYVKAVEIECGPRAQAQETP